jgi:hypothetical protein
VKLPPSRTSHDTSWNHTCNTSPLRDIRPRLQSQDIVTVVFFCKLLLRDKCHVNWTFGVGSSGQIATRGTSSGTPLEALSTLEVMNRSKQYLCVLRLKCRNLEGFSGEHQKLWSARQEPQVLKKMSWKASFQQNFKTFGFEQDICIRTRLFFSLVLLKFRAEFGLPELSRDVACLANFLCSEASQQ